MPSDVDVASMALLSIGSEAITSLDPPDDTVRARLVSQFFATIRDGELRKHPWNFALVRVSLAADATAPAWGFARAFVVPSDNLRIIKVNGEDRDINSWRLEQGRILTDKEAPIEVQYIQRVTDAEAWDPLFVELITAKLAVAVAEKLSGIDSVAQTQRLNERVKEADARSMDAFEQTAETTDDTNDYSWLQARL